MKNATATAMQADPMKSISEIFASGDQWILPPIPLLDEEFDEDENLGDEADISFLFLSGHSHSMAHN